MSVHEKALSAAIAPAPPYNRTPPYISVREQALSVEVVPAPPYTTVHNHLFTYPYIPVFSLVSEIIFPAPWKFVDCSCNDQSILRFVCFRARLRPRGLEAAISWLRLVARF
jgi:hypothetical protein